jgi:hypothetical protein
MFMLAAFIAGMNRLKIIGPNHPDEDAEMKKERKEDGDGQTQSENRYQQKQFSARPIFSIGHGFALAGPSGESMVAHGAYRGRGCRLVSIRSNRPQSNHPPLLPPWPLPPEPKPPISPSNKKPPMVSPM